MNKELAHYMRLKIQDLPFTDVVSGMVATLTKDYGGDSRSLKRFPVSYDTNDQGNPCYTNPERDLVPDSNKKSIIYFEDFGISPIIRNGARAYQSQLRLVCWLNRSKLVNNTYQEIAGRVMATLIERLQTNNPENYSIYTRLETTLRNIPAVSADIFGRYSYDETIKQYLMPPFDYFALDLVSIFNAPLNCMEAITWNTLPTCQE